MIRSSVFLSCDPACWTPKKIAENTLGGAEFFFLRLRDCLLAAGHNVYDPILNPTVGAVDLCIHSNSFDFSRQAKKHCVWAGSWHASVHEPRVDKVIVISEFMKRQLKCDRAIVIPAPYDKKIDNYKGFGYVKGRIMCHSNPNRHFRSTQEVATRLKEKGIEFDFSIAGGNRLYGDGFGECYNFHEDSNLIYRGVLQRHDLLGLLSSAHVWAYFNDEKSETQCVSAIEASALGIPVVVVKKEPFVSILPDAFFVESTEEMADKIVDILQNGPHRVDYDMSCYSEDVVMPQILKEIEEII